MQWTLVIALSSLTVCLCSCKPGASSKVAQENTYVSPGQPITKISQLAGRWTGRSSCKQRVLEFRLDISISARDQIEGVLKYDPLFKSSGFSGGIYQLHGMFNNGNLDFAGNDATDWISRPEGHTIPRFSGRINSTIYQGQIIECQQPFTLTRPPEVRVMQHSDSSIYRNPGVR
jgi:hypothetical protein